MTNTRTTIAVCAALAAAVSTAFSAEPKVATFPSGVDTPAQISLLKRHGKEGRDNPFYDNYRPQIKFTAEKQPVTCTVRVPSSTEKVEPGQTADVALNCSETFRSLEEDKSFVVTEGGRTVAAGKLK